MLFQDIDFTNKLVLEYINHFKARTILEARNAKEYLAEGLGLSGDIINKMSECIISFNKDIEDRFITYSERESTFQMLPDQYKLNVMNSAVDCLSHSGNDKNILFKIKNSLKFILAIKKISNAFCIYTVEETIRSQFGDDAFYIAALITRIKMCISNQWNMDDMFSSNWENPMNHEKNRSSHNDVKILHTLQGV